MSGQALAVWIATFGGLGYFPVAPGSLGAAAGLLWLWRWHGCPSAPSGYRCLVAIAAAVIFRRRVPAATGGRESIFGRKDPGPSSSTKSSGR